MDQAKVIIIVDRKLSEQEEQTIATKNSPIYLLQSSHVSETSKLLKLSKQVPESDDPQEHLQRIIHFAHKPLVKGSSIAELLRSNSSSDWYYLRFSLFHRTKNSFYLAQKIKRILAHEKEVESIDLYSDEQKIDQLINIPIRLKNREEKSKKRLSAAYLFNFLLLFGFRSLYGIFRNVIVPPKSRKMIIANLYLVQKVIDHRSGKVKWGDPHLQSIIDESLEQQGFSYLTQLRPPSLESNHQLRLSDYITQREFSDKSIYFEPYLLRSWFSRKYSDRKKNIKAQFNLLEISSKEEILSKEDRFLLRQLLGLRKTLLLAKWRETAADLLFKENPQETILCIDEHSLQNRSILTAAVHNGCKTIAIQHGAISKANIAYRFVEDDKSFHPFPSLSLLRGEYNRRELIKNHYPEESLKVVGHPRTDSIPTLIGQEQEVEKTVYATQPMPPADKSLKTQQLDDFLKLCQLNPHDRFVIKPHPNEAEISKYRKLVESGKYPNLELFEGELYLLLANCKLLITYYSTVGLEAVYFGKEVISLDYQKKDLQSYVRLGIAHPAQDGKQLLQLYQKLVSGEIKTNEEARKIFIKDRAFEIDGSVTERVLSYL